MPASILWQEWFEQTVFETTFYCYPLLQSSLSCFGILDHPKLKLFQCFYQQTIHEMMATFRIVLCTLTIYTSSVEIGQFLEKLEFWKADQIEKQTNIPFTNSNDIYTGSTSKWIFSQQKTNYKGAPIHKLSVEIH